MHANESEWGARAARASYRAARPIRRNYETTGREPMTDDRRKTEGRSSSKRPFEPSTLNFLNFSIGVLESPALTVQRVRLKFGREHAGTQEAGASPAS
jgi:hypothetical protein